MDVIIAGLQFVLPIIAETNEKINAEEEMIKQLREQIQKRHGRIEAYSRSLYINEKKTAVRYIYEMCVLAKVNFKLNP